MALNMTVVGPGRTKQGTGPYVAHLFHQKGVNISAVVSSSLTSAAATQKYLSKEYNIQTLPYATLEEALNKNEIDIVAICTPAQFHYQYLNTAIKYGCHIFCEKPLWWPNSLDLDEKHLEKIKNQSIELIQKCAARHLILQLNTQWPFTLPSYYELYPNQLISLESLNSFSMWLSPQSKDYTMIIDSVPHLLSMLYAIAGAGRIQHIKSNFDKREPTNPLEIKFEYLYAIGNMDVELILTPTDSHPKPAAYSINGNRVDRHVELKDYLISLRSPSTQLTITDPLDCSIRNFIGSIHSNALSDEVAIVDGMTQLAQIYRAITSR